MDALTRGVPVKLQYFAICSTIHKMLLFAAQWWGNAISDEIKEPLICTV